MVFSSLVFLYVFFPICLVLYFTQRTTRRKNIVLLIMSILFYAWGEPLWVFLMIFTGLVNWGLGIGIGKTHKKWLFVSAVVIDIGMLGIFKYAGFFAENINLLTGLSLPVPNNTLPIGISFYTFQTLSYVIDVYQGKTKAQKSFPDLMLFICLFPQLIAGPILRYEEIAAQIEKRKVTLEGFAHGITKFFAGFGKKILIANVLGQVATTLLADRASVFGAWLGIFLFALQIYFDFSGYSDMAIGLGRMFGFSYGENFNYPYISRSITEFWRRWHITLGSIFRDYVYIPMGGNRHNQVRNMFVVWLLTGFWHGASWNYILWGLYFFVFLLIEKKLLLSFLEKHRVISHIYALFAVLVSWVLFYFESFTELGDMYAVMFGFGDRPLIDIQTSMAFVTNLPLIIIAVIACMPIGRWAQSAVSGLEKRNRRGKIFSTGAVAVYNAFMLFCGTAALVGSTYNPFLYFKF